MADLVKVHKDGDVLEVHPLSVDAHLGQGWRLVDEDFAATLRGKIDAERRAIEAERRAIDRAEAALAASKAASDARIAELQATLDHIGG
ncbi:hypothetical protein [Paludisphaera mucosa]|uniref:Uncharacterized protein n=1 Tax=Paludisphaera mucosa TaxID=3030827 RepID=A0ABT6FLV4_9BACT|nr:hypothetical protein [Paludisphaera mucosa]MDG3008529.1 hypothetical protein [Paludisphaera mucosa]